MKILVGSVAVGPLGVAFLSISMSKEINENELLQKRLREHVEHLAGTIGERNAFRYRNLEAARGYIESSVSEIGYSLQHQMYSVQGRDYRNVIVEKFGATHPEKVFIIGAHYDSAWGTPGADDNASGVACLLELARLLFNSRAAMTLRFAAFTLEEPPNFRTSHMGSLRYAKKLKKEKAQVTGMISLEMVGYYRDERRSQHFPFPLMSFLFPDQGNFAAVAGNFASRRLVGKLAHALAARGKIPVEQVALPLIPGIGLSDNWSFWQQGYPAVMITDTAFFRNPHYHRPSDLPHTLDYRRLALLTSSLSKVVTDLTPD